MKREHIIQSLEPLSSMQDWPRQKRDDGLRDAAVLVPLIERDEWHVLLTTRTDHLHHHPGQISFPGGRADSIDQTPVQTALRETHEEVGIDESFIDIAGLIEPYLTVTSFSVVPIVGFVDPGFTLNIDPFEVADAFEVPLSSLADPSKYQRKETFWQEQWREYWELTYQDQRIWGATAAMLYALSRRLQKQGF
tara:strand:- start:154810 stop:155388 length:579 start_codon:yes stop_codon:yes gene_type:complete